MSRTPRSANATTIPVRPGKSPVPAAGAAAAAEPPDPLVARDPQPEARRRLHALAVVRRPEERLLEAVAVFVGEAAEDVVGDEEVLFGLDAVEERVVGEVRLLETGPVGVGEAPEEVLADAVAVDGGLAAHRSSSSPGGSLSLFLSHRADGGASRGAVHLLLQLPLRAVDPHVDRVGRDALLARDRPRRDLLDEPPDEEDAHPARGGARAPSAR